LRGPGVIQPMEAELIGDYPGIQRFRTRP